MRAVITGGNMHVGTAVPLEFTSDGRLLLTDVAAGALVLTNVASGKEARRFTLPTAKNGVVTTSAARLIADGRRLLVLGQTQTMSTSGFDIGHRLEPLRAWNVSDGREVLSRAVPCSLVEQPVITPDGRMVALPTVGKLLDVHTGREWFLHAKVGTVGMPIAMSGDSRLLAIAEPGLFTGPTRALQIFEVLTGRRVARVEADLGWCRAIGFSNDGRLLAAAGKDALHVWEMPTGKRLLHLAAQGRLTQWHNSGFATSLDFSPGGKAIATGHGNGTIHLWDLANALRARHTGAEDRCGGVLDRSRRCRRRGRLRRDRSARIGTRAGACLAEGAPARAQDRCRLAGGADPRSEQRRVRHARHGNARASARRRSCRGRSAASDGQTRQPRGAPPHRATAGFAQGRGPIERPAAADASGCGAGAHRQRTGAGVAA